MRIQFDIEGEFERRFRAQLSNERSRHDKALEALQEWVNRREARDERARRERLNQDIEAFRPICRALREEEERAERNRPIENYRHSSDGGKKEDG